MLSRWNDLLSLRPVTRAGAGWLTRLAQTPGGPQIILRAFLGVTFTYAGLQKLANRFFFNASNPGSIQAQLHASIATSPIGGLLRPAAHVRGGLGIADSHRRAGSGSRHPVRALRQGCRRGRHGAVVHLVPVGQLQHHALFLRIGHRLLVRLDPARHRRLGRVVSRRRAVKARHRGTGRRQIASGPPDARPRSPRRPSKVGTHDCSRQLYGCHRRDHGRGRQDVR